MEEDYDVIVMGTGLKECVLSGLFSVAGKKVLHLDRNDYYGGACASLNLNQLYQQFRNGAKPDPAMGASRDYNVDIVPKFLMSAGSIVDLLLCIHDLTEARESAHSLLKLLEEGYEALNGI